MNHQEFECPNKTQKVTAKHIGGAKGVLKEPYMTKKSPTLR